LSCQHFDEAGAIHTDGLALVCDILKRNELAIFSHGAACDDPIGVIEGGEIETLAEDKYFCNAITTAANERLIVTS
jgi:hypothetical protein